MQCPVDGERLRPLTYEADIEVDRCAACGGTWLDAGELERVEETYEKDHSTELAAIPSDVIRSMEMARQQAAPRRACPKCSREMERREYGYCSRILIDACPACRGVWLDKGELGALEIFFEKSRADTRELRTGFWASLLRLFH
ncbi:MAG: hypothetical protein GF331_17605 [Chitinivibrionales bacterium]|nr:hypothetical protein [Chitinivibrionales bacterium]